MRTNLESALYSSRVANYPKSEIGVGVVSISGVILDSELPLSNTQLYHINWSVRQKNATKT